MRTLQINLLLLGALAIAPLLFTSRAHPVAAGAAGAAAYDHRQEEQKKEDLAKHRQEVKGDRDR